MMIQIAWTIQVAEYGTLDFDGAARLRRQSGSRYRGAIDSFDLQHLGAD
jgi:hypothetical protein